MRTSIMMAVAQGGLVLGGCVGGPGSDAGTDGGFPDTPITLIPATHVVDESGDLRLLLTFRLDPVPIRHEEIFLDELEITAYDDATGELVWVDRETFPDAQYALYRVGPLDPRTGVVEMETSGHFSSGVRLDYDPRAEAWVPPVDEYLHAPWTHDLDFGAFLVRYAGSGGAASEARVYGRDLVFSFRYLPGPITPPIDPRAVPEAMLRGPRGTLMVDVVEYGPPEPRVLESSVFEPDGSMRTEYIHAFVERRIDGARGVYFLDVETGSVVGLGDRIVPEGVDNLRVGHLVEGWLTADRSGRRYFRNDNQVTREPIYRAGIDGTLDEVVLDWGGATECLLTQIFDVGPEGHILALQRLDDRLSPEGVVCLFAPDGSFVLSLPSDPQRVWVGFSDPMQWY